jgi:class 3 adenylate cyclase
MNDQSSTSHPLKAISGKFESHEKRQWTQEQKPGETPSGRSSWPSLSPKPIQSPAVLIDHELRVVWQNEAAWTHLWRQPETTEIEPVTHLFDLLMNPSFRNNVVNWMEWATYFVRQIEPLTDLQSIQSIIEQRDEAERGLLMPLLSDLVETSGASQMNCLQLKHRNESPATIFSVVGTTFDKGRLLVFEILANDAAQNTSQAAGLHQRFATIRSQPAPVRKVFYAMAARLNKAGVLKAEMLDEDYSRLVQRLWQLALETMEQNGGIVAQITSDCLTGFFLPMEGEVEPDPLFVIQCALELKTRMGELGRELRIRRGWLHDIELNIGLEAGNEYMMVLPTILGETMIPAGDALQVAERLAQLAGDGQIWATKALINQVSHSDLKNIRFGIFRSENNHRIFIANSFSRIREIPAAAGLLDIPEQFPDRSVTQIFEKTSHD